MSQLFRAGAGISGLAALIIQYVLITSRPDNGGVGAATLAYFSYFTILSNIFATAVFLAPLLAPERAIGKFLATPSARTASALYLANVGVVYHSVLASQWDPQGWQLVADIILHTVMPAAAIADWVFLTPKRALRLGMVRAWLGLPLFFGAYSLARGAMTGVYPYPFLRVTELGYPAVLFNMALLFAGFAATGALMVFVGRRWPARMSA